jgi:hypothetical protein
MRRNRAPSGRIRRRESVTESEAASRDDLQAAFQRLKREGTKIVLLVQDTMFLNERKRIALFAMAERLPTMFGFRENVEDGGLMSYGTDLRELAPHRHVRGQNLEGHQGGRSATGVPDEIGTGDQLDDCESPRPRNSANLARPRRRGDRVSEFAACLLSARLDDGKLIQ